MRIGAGKCAHANAALPAVQAYDDDGHVVAPAGIMVIAKCLPLDQLSHAGSRARRLVAPQLARLEPSLHGLVLRSVLGLGLARVRHPAAAARHAVWHALTYPKDVASDLQLAAARRRPAAGRHGRSRRRCLCKLAHQDQVGVAL